MMELKIAIWQAAATTGAVFVALAIPLLMEWRRSYLHKKEKRERLQISMRLLYEHVYSHFIVFKSIILECGFDGNREKLSNIVKDSKSQASLVSSASIRDFMAQAVNNLYGPLGRDFSLSSSRLQFTLWQLEQLLTQYAATEWRHAVSSHDESMAVSFALIQNAANEGSAAAGQFLDAARSIDPQIDRKGVPVSEAQKLIERQKKRESQSVG